MKRIFISIVVFVSASFANASSLQIEPDSFQRLIDDYHQGVTMYDIDDVRHYLVGYSEEQQGMESYIEDSSPVLIQHAPRSFDAPKCRPWYVEYSDYKRIVEESQNHITMSQLGGEKIYLSGFYDECPGFKINDSASQLEFWVTVK